jgi:hypothetical protein
MDAVPHKGFVPGNGDDCLLQNRLNIVSVRKGDRCSGEAFFEVWIERDFDGKPIGVILLITAHGLIARDIPPNLRVSESRVHWRNRTVRNTRVYCSAGLIPGSLTLDRVDVICACCRLPSPAIAAETPAITRPHSVGPSYETRIVFRESVLLVMYTESSG